MESGVNVVNQLVNSPLPTIIEKLGLAIAQAQAALDRNSIAIASEMAATEITLGGEDFNLINLGFTPTFYQFTEAAVEAKLEFTITESEEIGVGGSVSVGAVFFAATLNASYARKYEMSTEGSSAISARLVSLPAPERFNELLAALANPDETGA